MGVAVGNMVEPFVNKEFHMMTRQVARDPLKRILSRFRKTEATGVSTMQT